MKKALAIGTAWSLPLIAFAQGIQNVLVTVSNILALAVPILITLAIIGFFWGLVKYLWGGAQGAEEGKNIMIWGVIALFVMVSVYGLIQLLGGTFGINQGGTLIVPQVPR
jgi:hypothetical protein